MFLVLLRCRRIRVCICRCRHAGFTVNNYYNLSLLTFNLWPELTQRSVGRCLVANRVRQPLSWCPIRCASKCIGFREYPLCPPDGSVCLSVLSK